ncbi:hypothetical protein BJY52DRAFT_1185208 [Lactarius psammicola]|nr:hypothetical protein BJY52DRAFT_1185208 [Lactarius psammicola]
MRLHIPFLLLNAFLGVRAFTVTTSTATQCGTFTVNWTGGQPPFVLEIFPVQQTQQVFNIPASAFNNGIGSYSTVLQLAQEKQFLVTISDATGFATGGISPLLTVQAQTPQSSSCNTAEVGPQFFFSLDVALQQCRPYTFSQYPKAVLPVTIYGLVPGGTAVVLNAPNGATEYVWNPASIAAGTSVVFVMSDAQNHTGGVSDIKIAGSTDDTSCLNANSPSVTQQSTPSTRTSSSSSASRVRPTASSASSAKASAPPSSNNISGTTLIAAIAGTLVFLGVLAALGVFLFRRCRKNSSRRRRANFDVDGGYHDSPSLIPVRHEVDPFPTPPATSGAPYEMARMENSAANLIPHPVSGAIGGLPPPSPVQPPSASSRKTNMTASTRYQPAQFILHTDAEEVTPDENGFIELPPQYSENRRPLAPPSHGSSGSEVRPLSQFSHTP